MLYLLGAAGFAEMPPEATRDLLLGFAIFFSAPLLVYLVLVTMTWLIVYRGSLLSARSKRFAAMASFAAVPFALIAAIGSMPWFLSVIASCL